ncbi:MAG: hypothetical protein ACO1QR_11740 [Chthoniobacteraceae bacterium]
MKLLLILGLLAALIFVVLQAGPAAKMKEQADAAQATPPPTQVPGLPAASPEAKTHYKRSIDKAQGTLQAVKARNGDGEF